VSAIVFSEIEAIFLLSYSHYYSLCIIYLMVALANWLSVSIVAVVGPKVSLIVSGALYV
jgi:hypothetical protein